MITNNEKFDIKAFEQIRGIIGREMLKIHEDVSVREYEKLNPVKQYVWCSLKIQLNSTYLDQNLKNKCILCTKYRIE